MKYENIAESQHFFDFVFYEVEGKTMFIYCPNCGCEHEVEITKKQTISWIKEKYRPCDCFSYRGQQPSYKRSSCAYESLNRIISVAEFENRGGGDAALCVYWHTADFAASNYDTYDGCPFRRHPVYDEKKVIEILYKHDGTVAIGTSLYTPMCSHSIKSGEWRTAKKWRATQFAFEIITQSYSELKGTDLEQYVPEIERFAGTTARQFNIDGADNEIVAAWLIQMHTNAGVKKLWKSGYDRIVLNKTIETMMNSRGNTWCYYNGYYTYECSHPTINYRGKTLEKILKIQPQKFDLIADREDATVKELQGAQTVAALKGVDVTLQNVQIVLAHSYDSLSRLYAQTKYPTSKMFKFIRHEANRNGGGYKDINEVVGDYCDYLDALKQVGTPFTKDVVFPSNFTTSHDRATKVLRDLTVEMKDKAFTKAVKHYSALAYTDGNFQITVVKSATGLKNEAAKMHNCSAGYIDKIIGGCCVIFVIRQTTHPRTPFCMLEYSPTKNAIIQNRAVGNKKAPEEAQAFAEMWLNQIVRQRPATAAADNTCRSNTKSTRSKKNQPPQSGKRKTPL